MEPKIYATTKVATAVKGASHFFYLKPVFRCPGYKNPANSRFCFHSLVVSRQHGPHHLLDKNNENVPEIRAAAYLHQVLQPHATIEHMGPVAAQNTFPSL